MKIRRIDIQGFKSFADRTSFEFDAGITAVVGPNGCGKSNIVDALKWALGDMSPRSLRGKRMEDVIFAGSRHRKPSAFAEVALLFDNEDGLLRTERTEVQVTRRLHRTGQSEYLVNGEAARLKDIRELFYDTGLGVEGNAIMEQGQIDALLAANPQDRRAIFEEAAGVSRYKQRRKEAEQRLRRTEENLERLRDVLELEEKRLRSLKTQAGRARRYQALREDLKRKQVLRAVLRFRRIRREKDALSGRMDALASEEQQAADDLAALEAKAREAEVARTQAREAIHEVENRITEAVADSRAARDRADYAARTRDELAERIEAAGGEARRARGRIEEILGEIRELEREANEAEALLDGQDGRLEAAERDLSRLEREAARIRDAHEGAKREALEALGRLSDLRNVETGHRAAQRQAEDRLARLASQRTELEGRRTTIEGEARELEALALRLAAESRARADALEAAEDERARRLDAAERLAGERAELSETRATQAGRLELLERLDAAHEGVDEGAKAVLEAIDPLTPDPDGARDGVVGILADLLDATPEGARVLDRLLGPASGALVVRSTEDALRWIAWLRARDERLRGRFLCLDLVREAAPPLPEDVGPLGCDERLRRLAASVAAGTVLADDLAAGIDAWRRDGVNAVTPQGDRVTASGALLGGADGRGLGLVGRHAEIQSLRASIADLDGRLREVREAAARADGGVREQEEELRRLRADLQRHGEDRSRRGEALARVDKERSHVTEALESLALEIAEVETSRDEAAQAAEAAAARVADLEGERATIEERAEEAARGYLALEQERKAAAERRMEVRLAVAEAKARAEAARSRVARARDEIERLRQQAVALDEEAETLRERSGRAEVEIAEAEAAAEGAEGARREAARALGEARERLEALEAGAGGEASRREELHRLYEQRRGQLESMRLKDSELRVRIETLVEQVAEELGLDLPSVAEEVEADDSIDLDAVDAEVEQLRQRMTALGNVNLNAIAELEEVEEHVTFLQAQEKDLLEAKADLARVIEELDRVSRERFAETFEHVREHFRQTFRRLFGGGRAEIVLEDASDPLESGVDIIARPPGKEQRTISLLSGGERTLTAVALLFAVFKARPSPFAVLDEVDAALDEANVRRLIALVGEFTDRSQFVIVTHAKTTMEAADVLYGVTMQEPGVSKRVAVRLTEHPEGALAAG